MSPGEFQHHMSRLANQFKQAYGDERVSLILREVGTLSGEWWARTVDQFIGYCRQAPLMPEIAEAASRERERLRQIEKRQEANDAKAFMRGAVGPDEIRVISQGILKRLSGGMSDADFTSFHKALEGVSRSFSESVNTCPSCGGSGLQIAFKREDQTQCVFRCRCGKGHSDPRRFAMWNPHQYSEYTLTLESAPSIREGTELTTKHPAHPHPDPGQSRSLPEAGVTLKPSHSNNSSASIDRRSL
jgi:hypothetical protein